MKTHLTLNTVPTEILSCKNMYHVSSILFFFISKYYLSCVIRSERYLLLLAFVKLKCFGYLLLKLISFNAHSQSLTNHSTSEY